MHYLHLLVASLSFLTAATVAEQANTACRYYVLVEARGTGEPQGSPSASFINMTSWTLGNVTNGGSYHVVYPADLSPLGYPNGSQNAVSYIQNGSVLCPNQKYALLGYSQGANVILDVIRNITGSNLEPLIAAVITTGDPFQVPFQNITIDQNGGNSTRSGTGALLATDLTLGFSQHWVASNKVQQFCYQGDPVCNAYVVPVHQKHVLTCSKSLDNRHDQDHC